MKSLVCLALAFAAAGGALGGCKGKDDASTLATPGVRGPAVAGGAAARQGMAGEAPGQPVAGPATGEAPPPSSDPAVSRDTTTDPGAADEPTTDDPEATKPREPETGVDTPKGDALVVRAMGQDFSVRWTKLRQDRLKELQVPVYQGAKGIEMVEAMDRSGPEMLLMLCEKESGAVGSFYKEKLASWGDFRDQVATLATFAAAQEASKQPGAKAPTLDEMKKEVRGRMLGEWRISKDGTTLVAAVPVEGQKRTAVAVMYYKEGILAWAAKSGDLGFPGLAPGKRAGAGPSKGH